MSAQFEFDREETLCTQLEAQLKAALTNAETVYSSQRQGAITRLLGAKVPPHRRKTARLVRQALNALEERPRPAPHYPYPPEPAAGVATEPGQLRPLQPLQPLRPVDEQ